MEDYKKKYEEALNRAKGAYNSAKSDKENGVTDKITEYTLQLTETIFPELKESEDEKIRKALKEAVCYYWNDDTQAKLDCLAWLEKQGKELAEKTGEQKSEELTNGEDYDIDHLYNAARIFEKALGTVKHIYEQNPAWSEEDEYNLNWIINDYERASQTAISSVWEGRFKTIVSWLKSLKEKYTWKPSDAQMEALEKVRVILHNSNIWDESNPILYQYEELMRDLMKLREE